MDAQNRSPNRKAGSALVIVMCVSALLLITGISLTWFTSNATHVARKMEKGSQALEIAEAGVADMLSKMSTNYTYWMNSTFSSTFGSGSYSVVTRVDPTTGHVLITSTGTVGTDSRTTVMELLGDLYSAWDATMGTDGCIISGGDSTIDTSALTVNGSVHANGSVLSSKGNPYVKGDISACGTVAGSINGPGTRQAGSAAVVVPDYRKTMDAWKDVAQNGGLYYNSTVNLTGAIIPPNGVIFVNGDLTIDNNSYIKGTIVCTGTVTIENRLTHEAYNDQWPAIIAGWDLNEFNRNTYEGVMFAGNNITFRNNRDVNNGALIAMNDVLVENSGTINPAPQAPQWSPTDTNTTPPEIIIGGWLK
jgi:hypothetical protein